MSFFVVYKLKSVNVSSIGFIGIEGRLRKRRTESHKEIGKQKANSLFSFHSMSPLLCILFYSAQSIAGSFQWEVVII